MTKGFAFTYASPPPHTPTLSFSAEGAGGATEVRWLMAASGLGAPPHYGGTVRLATGAAPPTSGPEVHVGWSAGVIVAGRPLDFSL
jgi:hypothetical protein